LSGIDDGNLSPSFRGLTAINHLNLGAWMRHTAWIEFTLPELHYWDTVFLSQ
jgi:hypothetical protein